MEELFLFTDGSVNTITKIGYGAYILVKKPFLTINDYKEHVRLKLFENTSSTKLELETLLWALNDLKNHKGTITVYTDSQNIVSLLERRQKLEQTNYLTSKNKLHTNHLIYKEFFTLLGKLDLKFIKVKGHQPKHQKNEIDLLFSFVDKASRKALKKIF